MKRIKDIAALIAEGESQTIEFKTSFEREAIETLVAFANSQGGRVLVGVNDKGQTVGVSTGKETLNLQLSWDAHPASEENLNALAVAKIESFIEKVNESGRFSLDPSPLTALEKLKYISHGRPTLAALLLFAEIPLRHHIHIGRFKTPSLIIDDRQITDSLFEAVEQAMKFIISHISVAFEFNGSLKRKERFSYPLPALREVLLNAVVHRDYSNPSDIQIKIFDDSISFFSPGKLFSGLTIEDLQTDNYQSHLRNKLIAEAFYLTKNIEKYGSGFIRIRKELESYPEVSFTIEELGGGILVTFQMRGGVNGGVNEVLDHLRKHPGAKIRDIAIALGLAERTLQRLLKKLKEERKIAFKGATKQAGILCWKMGSSYKHMAIKARKHTQRAIHRYKTDCAASLGNLDLFEQELMSAGGRYLKQGITFKLKNAGHILGSCFILFAFPDDTGGSYRVIFSGGLGCTDTPILPDPDPPDACDLLILESTYGDRLHPDRTKHIPAFALGRTQELLYELDRIGLKVPVFIDSPLGLEITRIYSSLAEFWDKESKQLKAKGDHPFDFKGLYGVEKYQDHQKRADDHPGR